MLGCEMSGWGMGWGMGWGWIVGGLFMVGFWGLLIGGAIYVVRNLTGVRSDADRELARRFAAGEITEDEYRARLAAIRETQTERRSHV